MPRVHPCIICMGQQRLKADKLPPLLYKKIKKVAEIGIGIVPPNVIDKIGIVKSINLAAQKSLILNILLMGALAWEMIR